MEQPNSKPAAKTPAKRKLTRRQLLGGTLIGALGIGYYTRIFELHWVEVVHRSMPISQLPGHLDGKTLVQISDIHIGHRVDDNYLIRWFRQVSEWKPDFVVFTGDFLSVDRDGKLPIEQMKKVLANFPQGKTATIGILGNHDYGIDWASMSDSDTVTSLAQDCGIEMLRNRSKTFDGLQVIGFEDYWSPHFGGKSVLKNENLDSPTLVLCHNPDVVDLPIWRDYRGWILSGHTHGGQCKCPFLTPPILPIRNKHYYAGEFHFEDGRHLYVNRALGHLMPVRFNVRPEITVFHLVNSESSKT